MNKPFLDDALSPSCKVKIEEDTDLSGRREKEENRKWED